VAPEIVDIRQRNVRDFAPLLEAESQAWREHLRWDFTASARLISTCLIEKRISGFALVVEGSVKGYCFYFCDGNKGLIGNLFVEHAGANCNQARLLLDHAIESLIGNSVVSRVETQLPHFTFEQLEPCFRAHCFEGYRRRFMSATLRNHPPRLCSAASDEASSARKGSGVFEDFLIHHWERKHERAAAELLYATYVNHVDAAVNDQYSSLEGTTRLIENIVHHRGCGEFLSRASLVASRRSTQKLAAILVYTTVQPKTAHIPQIAVAKEFQGAGLGRALLEFSLAERAKEGYDETSLTVTDFNAGAVRLYERLGFETVWTFGAFVWNRRV
jgi:ribosomal protein S18 acetylase RimI-like enzyme